MVTLFKAFVFFWPFLKSVIFNDRPVKEVLYTNRHLTAVFLLFVVVSLVLVVMILSYNNLKREYATAEKQRDEYQEGKVPDIEGTPSPVSITCTVPPTVQYDKSGVIRLLDEGVP